MSATSAAPLPGPEGYPAIADPAAWPLHAVRGALLIPALILTNINGQIIYVSIVGVFVFLALVEWVLWYGVFIMCLVKVAQKAKDRSTRILAILNMVLFTALRIGFLGVMLATTPLPDGVEQYIPKELLIVLQIFAFYSFLGLITIPWWFAITQLFENSVSRETRIRLLQYDRLAPKICVVMPVYMEKSDVLMTTIDSIVGSDYPVSCMHIFLSYDGDTENASYCSLLESLGIPIWTIRTENGQMPKSLDIIYRKVRITVSRFPHGGKRNCQRLTWRLIEKIYEKLFKHVKNFFILFIDSDCILDVNCIQNFMYAMDLSKLPEEPEVLAMTGVITSHANQNRPLTILQDMEYVHGQLFERSIESCFGAVTCLPGALTCLRVSAFREVAKYYFDDMADKMEDFFDYGKCHLGEDRWLTHLFMVKARPYQIGMCQTAFCKTEAVEGLGHLLKQRRRWFTGFITNEACMLSDWTLWKRYPFLLILRLAQNSIRTTALLFVIMTTSAIAGVESIANLPVGFIALSLGLNWVFMIFLAKRLHRYKVMLYPLMFVVNPLLNLLYLVVSVHSIRQRTWGGPRADAAKANEHTTPAQAIEQAAQAGDDFNVDPTSFRAVVERKKSLRGHRYTPLPLQPGELFDEGGPTPQRTHRGYHYVPSTSDLTLAESSSSHSLCSPLAHRDSLESRSAHDSQIVDALNLRIVERVMDQDGILQYHRNKNDIARHNPSPGEEIQWRIELHNRATNLMRQGAARPVGTIPATIVTVTQPQEAILVRDTHRPAYLELTTRPSTQFSDSRRSSLDAAVPQSPGLSPYRYSVPRCGLSNYPGLGYSYPPSLVSQGTPYTPYDSHSRLIRESMMPDSGDDESSIELSEMDPLTDSRRRGSPEPEDEERMDLQPSSPQRPFFGFYADADGPLPGSKAKAREDKKTAKQEAKKKKTNRLTKSKWFGKKVKASHSA